jgi:hypothetical protein
MLSAERPFCMLRSILGCGAIDLGRIQLRWAGSFRGMDVKRG